jgi:hypothetical protein
LSKGCNIQEFSVGDTSVGDGLTLHPNVASQKPHERLSAQTRHKRLVCVKLCFHRGKKCIIALGVFYVAFGSTYACWHVGYACWFMPRTVQTQQSEGNDQRNGDISRGATFGDFVPILTETSMEDGTVARLCV